MAKAAREEQKPAAPQPHEMPGVPTSAPPTAAENVALTLKIVAAAVIVIALIWLIDRGV